MEEGLRPLVNRVVCHAGQDARISMGRLMDAITSNGWFTYGELFLAEIRGQGLIEDRVVDSWMAKLKALEWRKARPRSIHLIPAERATIPIAIGCRSAERPFGFGQPAPYSERGSRAAI